MRYEILAIKLKLILGRNSSNRIFNVNAIFELLVIYMSQYESSFPRDGIMWALILKLHFILRYQTLNGPYLSNLSDMYSYQTCNSAIYVCMK